MKITEIKKTLARGGDCVDEAVKKEIMEAVRCLGEAHRHLRAAYFQTDLKIDDQGTRFYCSTGMKKIIHLVRHLNEHLSG